MLVPANGSGEAAKTAKGRRRIADTRRLAAALRAWRLASPRSGGAARNEKGTGESPRRSHSRITRNAIGALAPFAETS